MSLTVNQKQEMVKFSEEVLSKAEIDRKWGLLHQTESHAVNVKEMFLMEIKSDILVKKQMIRK